MNSRTDAEALKAWRAAMGFTNQAMAAAKLDYSEAMVKKWESDPERHPVPLAVKLAMAALYHRLEPWK